MTEHIAELDAELDQEACWRAVRTRDARFDGRFFTCVKTTGIFCRPVCPARTPKPEHCMFLPSAAAAQAAGFRPCLRCRPEAAPGAALWRGTANTVSRALALIADGALDSGSGDLPDGGPDGGETGQVERLASRLGVGSRHLRRLFERHLGASPVAVAQTRRILFAKTLIADTALPFAEVALASGFGSVRRFNEAVRRTYGRCPGDLRRHARGGTVGTGIALKLPFVAPYDWDAMVAFLAPRAIPGIEAVERGRYRRTVALGKATGMVEVAPDGPGCLRAVIHLSDLSALGAVVARLRRLFDLDAPVPAIAAHLATDPRLAFAVAARPGLRVPGAWDGFELAVRAILGQQVSVRAATTLAGRLVAAHGEPAPGTPDADGPGLLFPGPRVLADADLTRIGLPRARAAAISAFAAAMAEDPDLLHAAGTLDETVERLCRLPGIGPWTAHYVAMRALHEPDAFPASDLGLRRAAAGPGGPPTPAALAAVAEAWRPWRAYAALHLWMAGTPGCREE